MLPSRINAGGVEDFGQENLKEHVAWVRLAVDRQYLRQYLAILSLWNSIPSAGASFREAICGGSTGSRLVYMTPNNLVLATGWKKQTLHNRFVSGLELWNGKQDGESAKSWEDSTGGRGGCVGGGGGREPQHGVPCLHSLQHTPLLSGAIAQWARGRECRSWEGGGRESLRWKCSRRAPCSHRWSPQFSPTSPPIFRHCSGNFMTYDI